MRQDGVEDGEQALKDEGLRAEEAAVDFAVLPLRGARRGGDAAAAFFAPFLVGGFGEKEGVLAGGVVGGEVGGED